MSKKVKRYNEGGDIVVTGRRGPMNSFDLARMSGSSGLLGGGMGGAGSVGTRNQRLTEMVPPSAPASPPMPVAPAVVRQPQSALGTLAGARTPTGYGASFRGKFAKGGKVKKMAKGGSTASKRADGCATKGKTKGRFV